MPKRKYKRSYSRPSKRRSTVSSDRAFLKSYRKFSTDMEPYSMKSSNRMIKYGPSDQQMMDYPGEYRTADQKMNRAIDRYYGPGGYWGDVGKNVGHWGTRIGGAALGAAKNYGQWGPMGLIGGAVTGWKEGAEISKAAGWGSYDVGRGANDLIGVNQGNGSTPIYHSATAHDDMGDVVISNRELVTLTKSSSVSGGFKVQSFTLNPADSTFHHLAQQSASYEQFEFLGLMFQYVPMTGEGGSNELGVIGMASSYDPEHSREFSSMEDLMRFKGATTCKPSVGMAHGIECDPSKRAIKTMYVRDNFNRTKDFTEPATFYFASDGVATADQTLGQLWVTYSVKLRNIKPTPSVDQTYSLHAATLTIPDSSLAFSFDDAHTLMGIDDEVPAIVTSSNIKSVIVDETETSTAGTAYHITFDKSFVKIGDHFLISTHSWARLSTGDFTTDVQVASGCTVSGAGTGVQRISQDPIMIGENACGISSTEENTNNKQFMGQGVIKITSDVIDPVAKVYLRFAGGLQATAHTNAQIGVRIAVTPLVTKNGVYTHL